MINWTFDDFNHPVIDDPLIQSSNHWIEEEIVGISVGNQLEISWKSVGIHWEISGKSLSFGYDIVEESI